MSLQFRRDFWRWKTRVHGLSYGVVYVILGLAIFVELRLVTDRGTDREADRQTDRRTHDDSIYRASIASCGNENGKAAVKVRTEQGNGSTL